MGEKEIFSVYEKLYGYIPLNNNSTGDNGVVTDFNNDIFKILYDYSTSKNNTTNFIEDVSKYLINYYGINDYVKKLQIINDKPYDDYGYYIYDSGKIAINTASISRDLNSMVHDYNFDNTNKSMVSNVRILMTLFHEFEHALQHKSICGINLRDIKNDNYEILLIYLSNVFFDKIIRNDVYNNRAFFYSFSYGKYRKLYDYFPDERFAFYYSCNKIKQVLASSNIDTNQIISFLNIMLYRQLLSGYRMTFNKKTICPEETFLNAIRKRDIWKKFKFYDKNREQLLKNI